MGQKDKTMTTMILKIEKANDKNNALIKNNADTLITECRALYQPKLDGMKTDDYREWMHANHPKMAAYLYDETGAPNKKGVCKPVMSQHKKNIFNNGIKMIATQEGDFLAWCDSDHGQGTSSLAKLKPAITAYQKSLQPKTETGGNDDDAENETGENETGENAKPDLNAIAKKLIEQLGHKDAATLSTMLWDMVEETPEENSQAVA